MNVQCPCCVVIHRGDGKSDGLKTGLCDRCWDYAQHKMVPAAKSATPLGVVRQTANGIECMTTGIERMRLTRDNHILIGGAHPETAPVVIDTNTGEVTLRGDPDLSALAKDFWLCFGAVVAEIRSQELERCPHKEVRSIYHAESGTHVSVCLSCSTVTNVCNEELAEKVRSEERKRWAGFVELFFEDERDRTWARRVAAAMREVNG